jgi:hypothetical protein
MLEAMLAPMVVWHPTPTAILVECRVAQNWLPVYTNLRVLEGYDVALAGNNYVCKWSCYQRSPPANIVPGFARKPLPHWSGKRTRGNPIGPARS